MQVKELVWLKRGQPCLHHFHVLGTVFSWWPFSSFSLGIILLPSHSFQMPSSNVLEASEEKTNGTKISRLLIDGGTFVSRIYFNSFHPHGTLSQVLSREKKKLEKGKKRGLIRDFQWEKLFPSAGSPNSETFDMTLLHFLIREIYPDPTYAGSKWNTMPKESDQSALDNLIRIRCFRNKISHSHSTGIPNDAFEDMWNNISMALVALGFGQTEIDRLKNEPIDHCTNERVKEANELWKLTQEINGRLANLEKDVQQLKERDSNNQVSEPRTESEPANSYLPDEVADVFGRDKQIKEVIEVIRQEAAAVITGGPGFGKTTVAIKAAYKLVQEHGRRVLFCDLTSKETSRNVETLMLLACSNHTSPDNPQHWLFNWSKELKSSVTFVLDNADDVVDRDCEEFLKFLSGIRTFSRQKVTFIITCRREFGESIRNIRIVRLGHLPSEEAKQVLWSRMTNPDSFKECLSKEEQLIKLCGYVPLALCIAGSLLSKGVYTEDELVMQLETAEPTAVLQSNRRPTKETSVEKSINISMEALDPDEQQALILLGSFPGSFNDEAAKFLIRKKCSTTAGEQASLILYELIDRSLLEKSSFQRYQVHSLIQAFSRKFSREKYPNLLTEGEKLACAHFISRIDNNVKQYWSKDTCKKAIDSFTEERHNFEHFLQVYIRGIQNQGHTTVEISKTFLDDFIQKCMYLEKCLQPSFYIQILESLLTSPEPEMRQPVKRVELLCLLGHEMRKKGEKSKYTDCMKEANQLFSENEHEFKTQALSEVFYRQSYARYLSERKGKGPNMEYKTAICICEEKYPDHPETAATLLFAGRYEKRRRNYGDVTDKYNRALDIFETQLGLHLMTAQCYKDIADFLFTSDETESYLDVTLACYQKAFGMMRELETDDQKESILLLKNYGKCQIKNGNFERGEKLLLKAESIAKRELEENHRWKVLVKTEQAVFYKKAARIEEMKAAMKEGLEMHYKIAGKRTLDGLGNQRGIREVLSCYPELFPQEQYPR